MDSKETTSLLDSLFRRYYVPKIVVREVRLGGDRTVVEIIDGQQHIHTAQLFLRNELPLHDSLGDTHPELPGARYSQLPSEVRRFADAILAEFEKHGCPLPAESAARVAELEKIIDEKILALYQ